MSIILVKIMNILKKFFRCLSPIPNVWKNIDRYVTLKFLLSKNHSIILLTLHNMQNDLEGKI